MMESQRTSSPKHYGEDYKESINECRGSYSPPDPEYLGSNYNLLIEWETGEITWSPLTNIMADVKHCGKLNARFVTDGHLPKEPTDTVYSGVVSLRNLRLAIFLAEHINIQLLVGADVGNAYLQALTKEKLYIVAGPGFEDL